MHTRGRAQSLPIAILLQDAKHHRLSPPPFGSVSHFCHQQKAADRQGKKTCRTGKRESHSCLSVAASEAAASLQFLTAPPAATGNGLQSNLLGGLHNKSFARTLHQATPLQHIGGILHIFVKFLSQPPGGSPVAVVEGVPGWQKKVVRGPRRWLGLRPGRALPIADAGPWWTPSGFLHLLQNVPTAVWLAVLFWLGYKGIQMIRSRLEVLFSGTLSNDTTIRLAVSKRTSGVTVHCDVGRGRGHMARGHRKEQQAMISAAKASDLLLQRDRMLRAFRGGAMEEAPQEEEEEEEGEAGAQASDPQWQDPSEWDPATRKQWEDFMRKSKAMRIQQERWWDIGTKDDTPHYKAAHDRLQDAGQLPDYS